MTRLRTKLYTHMDTASVFWTLQSHTDCDIIIFCRCRAHVIVPLLIMRSVCNNCCYPLQKR